MLLYLLWRSHHLDAVEKQTLFKDMASLLMPGGSFIIADLTEPMDPFGQRLAAKAWNEAVRQRSLDLDGDLRGYEQFRELGWNHYAQPEPDPDSIDKPSSLFDQLKWLDEAGFVDVECFLDEGWACYLRRSQARTQNQNERLLIEIDNSGGRP